MSISLPSPIRAWAAAVHGFLKKHRAARIALCALVIVLLLLVVLHPRGTRTFLILGIDNYGSLDENGRSDVMMLVQIDFSHSDVTTVTFARDMFIANQNGNEMKINTIVRNYDENALMQSLENDFGVTIDGWFRVNFTTVIQLVDAIGGANVELTAQEANYINRTVGLYPDNPLSEGACQLNGAQALCFARCRTLDNDLGRGQRQNRLMAAMVQQTRHMTLANIVNVFNSLKHAWTSSLSAGEQAQLLGSALWLRGAHVTSVGLPFEGYWRYGNSKSGDNGIVINLEENARLLQEALGLAAPAADDGE